MSINRFDSPPKLMYDITFQSIARRTSVVNHFDVELMVALFYLFGIAVHVNEADRTLTTTIPVVPYAITGIINSIEQKIFSRPDNFGQYKTEFSNKWVAFAFSDFQLFQV